MYYGYGAHILGSHGSSYQNPRSIATYVLLNDTNAGIPSKYEIILDTYINYIFIIIIISDIPDLLNNLHFSYIHLMN